MVLKRKPMRAALFSLLVAIVFTACSDKVQQLENAGECVKQAVSKCSLSTTPDKQINKEVSGEGNTDQKKGGTAQDISNGLSNRLKLW